MDIQLSEQLPGLFKISGTAGFSNISMGNSLGKGEGSGHCCGHSRMPLGILQGVGEVQNVNIQKDLSILVFLLGCLLFYLTPLM